MIDPDYFNQKRQELGLERYETLQTVQAWLEAHYPGQARAVSLNKGVLRLVTPSAAVASDLRFKQQAILQLCPNEADSVRISISKRS